MSLATAWVSVPCGSRNTTWSAGNISRETRASRHWWVGQVSSALHREKKKKHLSQFTPAMVDPGRYESLTHRLTTEWEKGERVWLSRQDTLKQKSHTVTWPIVWKTGKNHYIVFISLVNLFPWQTTSKPYLIFLLEYTSLVAQYSMKFLAKLIWRYFRLNLTREWLHCNDSTQPSMIF